MWLSTELVWVIVVFLILLFIATIISVCLFFKKHQDLVVIKRWLSELEKKHTETENKYAKVKAKNSELNKKYNTIVNKYNMVILFYVYSKNKTEKGGLDEMEKSLIEDYERFKNSQDSFID